ncbi:NUDIX domain-containing protein [Amylibacter sp. IMCC11727]|uniref:NUDIX hydrolase n=1 Tax=Amylibacter sp. IMCC11727 TaxID=3039851 RepID=UPI00244E4F31|nr:NUDIX domain-containing protein [Amylibacter sp. IMCC11727]WGI21116.1 NUDIX domain-containing protein [Amylibacter sp. IMCC11727]
MPELPIRSFAVSAVLIRHEGETPQVLLMRRADTLVGAWCQVAGKIEAGETAWHAALREIKEETGLVPERFYSADFCEQFYEADRDCISILPVFVGFVGAGAQVVLNAEHTAFEWLSFEEARARVEFSGQRDMLGHVEREFVQCSPSKHLRITLGGP